MGGMKKGAEKKCKTSEKPQKTSSSQNSQTDGISLRWAVRIVIVVTIVSIPLFFYFRDRAKKRQARINAEWEAQQNQNQTYKLACNGLMDFGEGYYQLYAGDSVIADFDVNSGGELVDLDGNGLSESLAGPISDNFGIKVIGPDTEVEGNTKELMSGTTILSVPYKGMFSEAEGSIVLDTPSDEDETNNLRGIWFRNLALPEPPEGWNYSAWLLTDTDTYLIGRFIYTDIKDESKSYYSGDGPSQVGEDFLENLPGEDPALDDLRKGNNLVVVSLEPEWHTENSPFPLPILGVEIPEDTEAKKEVPLEREQALASFPYCMISQPQQ